MPKREGERQITGIRREAALCVALALLAGCKEEKQPAAQSVPMAGAAHIRQIVERSLQGSARAPAPVRGVQTYKQAAAQRAAVCGQVAPFPEDANIFVPFVAVVTVTGSLDDPAAPYTIDQYVGTGTAEAARVYVALVNFCYEGGGPAAGRSVLAMPPLPDAVPDPAARPAPPPRPPVPGARTAFGSVILRQAANLHSDPHGPAVRVVPQGTVLRVLSQAPGGWYQVGDTAPWGWVHESMVEKR